MNQEEQKGSAEQPSQLRSQAGSHPGCENLLQRGSSVLPPHRYCTPSSSAPGFADLGAQRQPAPDSLPGVPWKQPRSFASPNMNLALLQRDWKWKMVRDKFAVKNMEKGPPARDKLRASPVP